MPRFQATVAAAQTDSSLVAAVAGRRVRVTSLYVAPGASTTATFNTKPAGAGTAISPAFAAQSTLTDSNEGWLETNSGEGLSVTTSAGAASLIVGVYQWIYR